MDLGIKNCFKNCFLLTKEVIIMLKKAQHSSIVFLLLFVSIVSIFTTISVLQTSSKDGIPTGLVVDEETQQLIAQQQAEQTQTQQAQEKSCDEYNTWFHRFTCTLCIDHWFYKETVTTTVYEVDENGHVVGVSTLAEKPE